MHKKLPKLDLNVTNRCHFQCIHCAFDSGCTKMSELSLPELEKILRDTKELGGERIDITGGEPTIRKDLPDIISIGKMLGYKIELVTNGSLLTQEKLAQFKQQGLDAIAISLDGSTYETYHRIRKVSREIYARVLQTIREAVALQFYTKVNTVAFTSNMGDIAAITEWCIQNKINEHGIYYFTPVGRGVHEQKLVIEPRQWLTYIRERLLPYQAQMKLSVEVPLLEKRIPNKGLGCIVQEDPYHLQILPNGDVYPCAILASYCKPLANLRKISLAELWQNEKIWKDYSQYVSEIFQKHHGFCVGFSSLEFRDSEQCQFVCPLRKFSPGEIT